MKKFLCAVMAAVMLLTLSSCEKPQKTELDTSGTIDTGDNGEPLVLYTTSEHTYLAKGAKRYNAVKGKDEVVVKTFDNREKLDQALNTEVLAGKGPDLIDCNEVISYAFMPFANNDMFVDLTPYFNRAGVDLSQYNEIVMDSGIVNKKRVMVPLSYFVPAYVSTEETLKKYDIPTDFNFLTSDYSRILTDKVKADPDVVLMPQITANIEYSLNYFMDYNTNTCTFATEEFKKLLENTKEVYDITKNDFKIMTQYEGDSILALHAGSFIFSYTMIRPTALLEEEVSKLPRDSVPRVYPAADCKHSSGSYAVIFDGVAISKNSKNKLRAFSFIEFLLSDTIQADIGISSGFPVKKDVVEKEKEEFSKRSYALNDQTKKDILSYGEVTSALFLDNKFIHEILRPVLQPYWDGASDIDTTVEQLQNKAELYLNE